MVNFREKLNINFDLSNKQIEILNRTNDTLIRAVPGGGKTTILTLKIKNLLLDNKLIKKICCISYTNVNVDDLEKACKDSINSNLLSKIEFLTFHRFCLQFILSPYSYLYRSKKGLRPYKKIFNFKEYGSKLVKFLNEEKINPKYILLISESESVPYNFKFNKIKNRWDPVGGEIKGNKISDNTIISYLKFLNKNRMIDFNLISLLSLFIIQENKIVRRSINKYIDWIFIDEFQDISDVQCKIIEELRSDRDKNPKESKWFMVGDPNQSIYGFAGANPRSMYDMKCYFNKINDDNCEIKIDKTYRCTQDVFDFAKRNYNNIINKIKSSEIVTNFNDMELLNYLNDLIISEKIYGSGKNGCVYFRTTAYGISEIINLKIKELQKEKVCCIGINRYNSIDVFKEYQICSDCNNNDKLSAYIDIYKNLEKNYGKYFDLFISYLNLKYCLYNDRIKYTSSVNKFIYKLKLLLLEKYIDNDFNNFNLNQILIYSCDLTKNINLENKLSDEINNFSERLSIILQKYYPDQKITFSVENNKASNLDGINDPTIENFLEYIKNKNNNDLTFEIKHIHKIKGLEYDQVIVQKIEDLPHPSNKIIHDSIFNISRGIYNIDNVYNYIQEINKLYVMLTRSKNNLYIIINKNKIPSLIKIDEHKEFIEH